MIRKGTEGCIVALRVSEPSVWSMWVGGLDGDFLRGAIGIP
jgi:hypothetical protein